MCARTSAFLKRLDRTDSRNPTKSGINHFFESKAEEITLCFFDW